MKCDKCGFVSFDHLAECRRCGADLEATRERLGFSPLKSEVPFLLGSLLKGGGPRDAAKAGYGEEPADSDQDRIAILKSEPAFKAAASPAALTVAPEVEAEGGSPAKEELIIELSEDDLESFSGNKGSLSPRIPGKSSDR